MSLKRKRGSQKPQPPPPPPFAPARAALAHTYTKNASRGFLNAGTSTSSSGGPASAAIAAGSRLSARDFRGAAALLPSFLRRIRAGRSRWFFPREGIAVGSEVLRRAGDADDLERFLTGVVRDPAGSHSFAIGAEGFGERVREGALLTLVGEMAADGRLGEALDVLRGEVATDAFASSAVLHAYVGVLSIVMSAGVENPKLLLAGAVAALRTAASLDPGAVCFVGYGAAAYVAAGDVEGALGVLRVFVEDFPGDAMALQSLLAALGVKAAVGRREERVRVARALLIVDPMAREACAVLREAQAWAWAVLPAVDVVEVANAVANRIECCGGGDVEGWTDLLALLGSASDEEIAQFMYASGRVNWWASHFFRKARGKIEAMEDPVFASKKVGVARLLFGVCEYVNAVEAVLGLVAPDENDGDDSMDCGS